MNEIPVRAGVILIGTLVAGCSNHLSDRTSSGGISEQRGSSTMDDPKTNQVGSAIVAVDEIPPITSNNDDRQEHETLKLYDIITNPSHSLLTKDGPGLVAQPLSDEDLPFQSATLERALAVYPEDLVRESLDLVIFVEWLKTNGIKIGGTYSTNPNRILISKVPPGNTDIFLNERAVRALVHHEFGSLLFHLNPPPFELSDWMKFVPPGYSYPGMSEELLTDRKYGGQSNSDLAKRGFVTGYAQMSVPQDLQETHARMMMGDPWFWEAYDKYPRMAGKVDLMVSWLHDIDPSLTYEYIRGLSSK